MTTERNATKGEPAGEAGRGRSPLRFGQLLTLLGLTGFAVSQPLLAVAGEDPTLFTFAGVQGRGVVVFALIVALVPPLVLWGALVLVGLVHRRAADHAFVGVSALLVAVTSVQWLKSAGVDEGWILGPVALALAAGFALALVRYPVVGMWTRFTSPLPAFAVFMLLVASPAGDLLRAPSAVEAASSGSADMPSVVFLMLDEFPLSSVLTPEGEVDAVRFPNLASLAEDATWYRNYTVMAPGTLQSLPSLLSGRVPSGKSALWTDHPDNLFSLLAPTHELTVSETVSQLCGYADCGIESAERGRDHQGVPSLLGQIVDVWRERVALRPIKRVDVGQFREEAVALDPENDVREAEGKVNDPDLVRARPNRVSDFIEALEPSTVPGLHYLHIMLPHQPWSYYPDGQLYEGFDFFLDGPGKVYDEWDMAQIQQAHLFQAQYADRMVGEIIDRLKESGMYDDSVLVVTSDHGVNFTTPPDLRRLEEDTIDDVAYVPLFIKARGQDEGRVDDMNLMAVDLVPTIAAEVGVEVEWEVDGHPAGSPEIEARGERKEIYNYGGVMNNALEGVVEFRSGERRPRAEDRLIGPVEASDHIMYGLVARIEAEEYLGRQVADLDASSGGAVQVADLDRLRNPSSEGPAIGRVAGTVDEPGAGDLVLLALNGTVVTAAPVSDDGSFTTLLPPGVFEPTNNVVTLLQVGPDGPQELDVR